MIKKITQVFLIAALCITVSINGFAQHTLKKIDKNGELRVGMTANQPPYTMKAKDGSVIGYDADLAVLLADALGVKITFVEMPFHELLDALADGDVDIVMSGMTMTLERNKKVAFAGPYTLSGKSFLTKLPDYSGTKDADELNSNTVKLVTLKGSTSESYARSDMPEAEILLAETYDDAIKMLEDGKASIMVADYPVCAYTVLVHPEKKLMTGDKPLTIEPIGMALPPDDAHFHNMIQNYLNGLALIGAFEALEYKWFETGEWVPQVK